MIKEVPKFDLFYPTDPSLLKVVFILDIDEKEKENYLKNQLHKVKLGIFNSLNF